MADPTQAFEDATAQVAAIGQDLVEHVKSGAVDDQPLWDRHFDPGFESVEADGSRWQGREQVKEKCDWWLGQFQVHSCEPDGPYVYPGGFAVKYEMDIEARDGSMPRTRMREIGVYTVENGKIVREIFMSPPQ